jgi:menaquinone-9 beta-reductase
MSASKMLAFRPEINPELGTWTGLIPQAGDQFRAYFTYPKTMGYRLQGESILSLFIRESGKGYAPMADYCADAKRIGLLASFDASDNWVEHSYRDGVVLVGDAAATSDPTHFPLNRSRMPSWLNC